MTTATQRATKVSAGEYLYKGYLIAHLENEDGTQQRQWTIFEDTRGGWSAIDSFAQLWFCKQVIDADD